MRLKRNFFLILVLLVVSLIASSWGFLVHRTANQLAVYKLPQPMQAFFYTHLDYLVKNSVRPDLRRNEDSTEAPKHFIDLEPFARWMRIGFEHPIGFRLEIIPLHLLHQIQRPGDGQPAQAILAFQHGNAGFQLVLEE